MVRGAAVSTEIRGVTSLAQTAPAAPPTALLDDAAAEIAKVVNAETGAAITLEDGTYVATKLGELDGFWAEHDRLAAVHGATQS